MNIAWEAAIINVLIFWGLTAPHEFAHAWMANRLGDDTPRLQGRLTLNPLAHVDWVGTVLLPLLSSLFAGAFLGWGRPVQINPSRVRGGVQGLALVAMAGPISNLLIAVALGLVFRVGAAGEASFGKGLLVQAGFLSVYLALFNLLPVPPLDGSRLLLAFNLNFLYREMAQFGFILLIVVMAFTSFGRWLAAAAQYLTALAFVG